MSKINFDDYHESYNELLRDQTRFFDKDSYFAEYKIRTVRQHLHGAPARILEYGCGIGRNLRFLQQQFPKAEIYGCDISGKSLEAAAKELPDAKLFETGRHPYGQDFDLIFVANVLHHVPPGLREGVLKDINNMLQPGGALYIFEHNPYNPVTRHMVNTCPFDSDAVLLKPAELKRLVTGTSLRVVLLHYSLFFPAFLKRMRFFEPLLVKVPLGGQYFVFAKKEHVAKTS